jgi:hypothetical protein
MLCYVGQGLRGDESLMPPLYTQPNCIDAVKNILCKLEDSVLAGKRCCALIV